MLTFALASIGLMHILPLKLPTGYSWTVERNCRFVDQAGTQLVTQVETLTYRVLSSTSQGLTLSVDRHDHLPMPAGSASASQTEAEENKYQLHFGPGGRLTSGDQKDPIEARVERMEWTAEEDTATLPWTQSFPVLGDMPPGTVEAKPTTSTAGLRRLSLTYTEVGGQVSGFGTAVVRKSPGLVESFDFTFSGLTSPAAPEAVKVEVTQKTISKK